MSLRLIETFVEAARLGSFSAAARVLGLSPGSVSQNIRNLEDQLDVRLFERTTRQVRLTSEGERYRSHVAPALEALREASEVARADRESLTGTLRITSTTAFGRDELMPVIAVFQAAHPDLRVELRLSDQFVDLIAEGFDLAIRAGVLPENDYIARLLVPVTPMIVAAPAYLERHGAPGSLDELTRHRLIGMRSNPSSQVFAWELAGPGDTIDRREIEPHLIVNDPAGLRRGAELGIGIAQMGSNLARPGLAGGGLLHLFPETMIRTRGIYAVYPYRRFMPRKVTAFVAVIATAFEQQRS